VQYLELELLYIKSTLLGSSIGQSKALFYCNIGKQFYTYTIEIYFKVLTVLLLITCRWVYKFEWVNSDDGSGDQEKQDTRSAEILEDIRKYKLQWKY
jgi:hypothetical protein